MKQQHRMGLTLMLLVIMFGVLLPEATNPAKPIADFIVFAIGVFLFVSGD